MAIPPTPSRSVVPTRNRSAQPSPPPDLTITVRDQRKADSYVVKRESSTTGESVEIVRARTSDKTTKSHRTSNNSPRLEDATTPTAKDTQNSAAHWTTKVRKHGPQAFLRALQHNDPSARAAMKDEGFNLMLTQTVKEKNQLQELLTNLLNAFHNTAKAGIRGIQV